MASGYDNRTDPVFAGTTPYNTVNLGITTHCSMRCPNCSVGVPRIKALKAARHASVESIFQAGQVLGRLRRVHVTGGEPTIHPRFEDIARNLWKWFDTDYVTLETNGAMFDRHADVVARNFDKVFVTHYERDAIYPGSPDNSDVIERADRVLGKKLIREPPVRHERGHLIPLGRADDTPPCSKWFDPGLPCGWYDGKLYHCCVTFGIDPALGIPVTPDWRDRLRDSPLGCERCCYRGT